MFQGFQNAVSLPQKSCRTITSSIYLHRDPCLDKRSLETARSHPSCTRLKPWVGGTLLCRWTVRSAGDVSFTSQIYVPSISTLLHGYFQNLDLDCCTGAMGANFACALCLWQFCFCLNFSPFWFISSGRSATKFVEKQIYAPINLIYYWPLL